MAGSYQSLPRYLPIIQLCPLSPVTDAHKALHLARRNYLPLCTAVTNLQQSIAAHFNGLFRPSVRPVPSQNAVPHISFGSPLDRSLNPVASPFPNPHHHPIVPSPSPSYPRYSRRSWPFPPSSCCQLPCPHCRCRSLWHKRQRRGVGRRVRARRRCSVCGCR